jgi:hypothetical protein
MVKALYGLHESLESIPKIYNITPADNYDRSNTPYYYLGGLL